MNASLVFAAEHSLLIAVNTTRFSLVWGSPLAVCVLWLSRWLERTLRLLVSAVVSGTAFAGAVLLDLQTAEALNMLVVSICGAVCFFSDTLVTAKKKPSAILNFTEQLMDAHDSGNAETTIIEDDGVLSLEDLAPEIDAMTGAEFSRRVQRSGIMPDRQLSALTGTIEKFARLSAGLAEAVSEKTITVYQALHLLWGKEDRLRLGEYVVCNVLGLGGMSVVYRARRISGGPEIALKVVPLSTRHEARFLREMQLAQLLAHPNIVVAHDAGRARDRYFIAMELVSGRNLDDVVRLHGSLSEAVALQYALHAARGLQHAHERGIIHRDVKPGNLLLCPDGTVKVADLGLSQPTGTVDRSGTTAAISGTIDFMAPEQASSQASSSPQIDIYGLGTTLFFLITGQVHVQGENSQQKLLNLTVRRKFRRFRNGSVTARTIRLVRKMTAYDAADRFESMTQVIAEIESILGEMGRDHRAESLHVFVVEDDPSQMYLTVSLLSRTNRAIEVSGSDRLQTAIDEYARHIQNNNPVNIVLMDLSLPDSAGTDSVARFRVAHPTATIIVLSGSAEPELPAKCRQAGAHAFLAKSDLSLSTLEKVLFRVQSEARSQSTIN